jgi:hypothetical protein
MKIVELDFKPHQIMDLLLLLRNVNFNLRQEAIEYYRKDKENIIKAGDYRRKYDALFDEDHDLDLIQQLMA